MFVTPDQLLAHAVGDYVLQSHWMATEKTRRSVAAAAHVATYGLPFLLLRPTLWAYVVIVGTHFIIDRWRLARFVVWAKNLLAPAGARAPMTATGYSDDVPAWLAVWLLIIVDNIIHVTLNAAALGWLH